MVANGYDPPSRTQIGASMPATSVQNAPQLSSLELGTLMRQYQLGLVLIAGTDHTDADAVAALPVQWVHGTDLVDPTPFLTPRTVLLTTGSQFATEPNTNTADLYVERLHAAGITALGFGVGLPWERIPPAIIAACERLELPLFRVPYETPFIAIIQTAARLISAQARERDVWTLESQRAVTSAALQRDGLAAAVRETANRLQHWVAITDRTGRLIDFAPRSRRSSISEEWIRREARALIERGSRGSRVRTLGEQPVLLSTLGRSGNLLGVLVAPTTETPEHTSRTLLGLVAALATVQLEHRTGVGNAEAALRAAVVQLLLAGDTGLAERIAVGVLPRLPRGRVVALRFHDLDAHDTTLTADLRSLAGGATGLLFAPYSSGTVLICEGSVLAQVKRVLTDHSVPAGVSSRGTLDTLDTLIEQAEVALERAQAIANGFFEDDAAKAGPIDYRPAMHAGVLEVLDRDPEARRRSETLLAPVRNHDKQNHDELLPSLHEWLTHNGQTSAAADVLGVHRHTLRTRLQTAAQLLERNLDDPDTRAELWTALRLTNLPKRS